LVAWAGIAGSTSIVAGSLVAAIPYRQSAGEVALVALSWLRAQRRSVAA
jgi:hypothetical protein